MKREIDSKFKLKTIYIYIYICVCVCVCVYDCVSVIIPNNTITYISQKSTNKQ